MPDIDLERLFKLRLTVARFGEMDGARWWNTQGILGRYGSLALERGFPKTHYFAQARVAFAVATQRCKEIYFHPNAHTLWDLPPEVEDRFQEKWHEWLTEADQWATIFKKLEDISGRELLDLLSEQKLIDPGEVENAKKLRRSAEGRSVPIPGGASLDDRTLTMLGAGFFRGETGKPAIPYLECSST